MKKFQFKLHKLLDLREAREKQIKNELAELVNQQNIERNKQIELQQSMSQRKEALRTSMVKKTFSYNEVLTYERFTDNATKAINIAETKIRQMEPAIQRVRGRLMEASKEKKVVEKLKERKYREYLYNLNREITKENDDTNQKIYLKKRADDLYQ
ncbi:MAG: flagellar export protein FliJ [Spirochaetes bacterium]|nr:flagellar export protein FliJ [Spirochaetota bacterium]